MSLQTARQQIIKARAGLVLDHCFFASLALRLQVVEDASAETMFTDGKVLAYNPLFVDKLSLAEIKGVLAHEVMHIALAHHVRRGSRDKVKWNMACDYAINKIFIL